MRDPNETITSRIRRADLAPLLDAMAGAERQRITAPMEVATIPPEATRSETDARSEASAPAPRSARKRAHTIAGKTKRAPVQVIPPLPAKLSTPAVAADDADVDAAFDAAVDELRADEADNDDRTTQPVTFTSQTEVDVVVRFATGTTSSQRFIPIDTSPASTSQARLTFAASDLRPRMPRWAIVVMSCVLTLGIAGLLIAAA